MNIMYTDTRDKSVRVTASQAVLAGLAPDGGLFVPEQLPKLDVPVEKLVGMSYQDTAMLVMSKFLTDYTKEELSACIAGAYDSKFDTPVIAPVKEAAGAWYLELFHGKTIAFKDMALSILPYLLTTAARKNKVKNEIVILTATSGDTGKAALAGFADVPGTKIIVFYPKHGVSPIQERQMVTQEGDNTCVIGIEGNFDDAQSAVKRLFTDPRLKTVLDQKGYQFSSANSINIGRLVPQIVYYVYAYAQMCAAGSIAAGEVINVTVPTGNFGNILAAYYAKQMGLPIGKLICASNENKVLFDFLGSGVYDRNREFVLTSSPSMDILISSNLERLIYKIAGCDAALCAQMMASLKENGRYEITGQMKEALADFEGGYATQEQTQEEIRRVYDACGYVLDPHTAVASYVYAQYRKRTGDTAKTLIASTASPYKFSGTVLEALGKADGSLGDIEQADRLCSVSGVRLPQAVEQLRTAKVRHDKVVAVDKMEEAVLDFLQS